MAEDARPYLDLSALPVYELTRPRSWARIGESVERVLEVAA
jgi:hypothetical protein